MTVRIAVLASGGGSNLQALLDYLDALGSARSAEVALVVSDRAEAPALGRAIDRGIPALHIAAADELRLLEMLAVHSIDLIALAGYLKLLPKRVTDRFAGRVLNVHPGPLPEFGGTGMYGRRVHEAVLVAGVTRSGVTVHFVDDQYDHGEVIAQWPVAVLPGDTADTLARRVLAAEHIVYPRIVDMVAAAIAREDDRR